MTKYFFFHIFLKRCVSVSGEDVHHLLQCLSLVECCKLEKIKIKTGEFWSEMIRCLKMKMKLTELHLTETWPPDSFVEELKNISSFKICETNEFSLNNNNILLRRNNE